MHRCGGKNFCSSSRGKSYVGLLRITIIAVLLRVVAQLVSIVKFKILYLIY